MGFPGGSAGKEYACNAGDLGSIPGLGRFPGEEKGYPLQYSGLENSMDCLVCGVSSASLPCSCNPSLCLLRFLLAFPESGFSPEYGFLPSKHRVETSNFYI